ncbi:MAG: RNA polymerase sigma factor [Clostridia bacterium]|nr:RNA polymerase sigma factor [Clostridia bacterium]
MEYTNARILSDDEIISLYWDRDENAIKQTDIKYREYLLRAANRILLDLQDSEECLDDTYLSAWKSIPPERPYLLRAFLLAIIRNHAVMLIRKNNRQKRAVLSQAVSLSELEDVLSAWDPGIDAINLSEILNDYLNGITKEQRYVFIGRYYLGKRIEDIAREMGVSRSKVNKQIAHIKQTLREKLAEEGIIV